MNCTECQRLWKENEQIRAERDQARIENEKLRIKLKAQCPEHYHYFTGEKMIAISEKDLVNAAKTLERYMNYVENCHDCADGVDEEKTLRRLIKEARAVIEDKPQDK